MKGSIISIFLLLFLLHIKNLKWSETNNSNEQTRTMMNGWSGSYKTSIVAWFSSSALETQRTKRSRRGVCHGFRLTTELTNFLYEQATGCHTFRLHYFCNFVFIDTHLITYFPRNIALSLSLFLSLSLSLPRYLFRNLVSSSPSSRSPTKQLSIERKRL